jgi:molecular chaperone Hsp33
VAGLLSAIIKFQGRLTVQFRGNGKLKLLLAQCDNNFQVRGLAKWEDDLTYSDLMNSFNQGVLVIMIDSNQNKNRYQGIVAWRGNSLVESIEGYFKESEQLATKIWLSVNEKKAAGFLLQVIPGSTPTEDSEKEIAKKQFEHIIKSTSRLDNNKLLLNIDYQTLLNQLYPEEAIRLFPSVEVVFQCSCSRKRGDAAILILGQKEAEEELKTHNVIVVTCDFCNKQYTYDRVDIAKIFAKKYKPSSNLH